MLQITDLDSLDLMFYTGDMLNWIGNENRIFKGFLDVSVNQFAKEKPFILLRGNHETRGPLARNLMQYFPHSSGRFYYSFNHGNVYFIIMDSGEDKPDSHPVYAGLADFDRYRDEQAEWLLITTQSAVFKQSLYKIVLVHIPLFSGSKGHGAKDITKKWGPILNKAKVDLLISGHHHRYSEIKKTEGRNSFPVLVIGKDMIMKTDVSEKHLLLTIKNIDGKIVDTVIIPAQSK